MDHNETLLPSAALRTCVTLQSLRNAGLDAAAALPMMIPGNTWRGNVVQTLDFRIYEPYMKLNLFLEWHNTVSHLISINPRKGKAEGGDFCRLTLPGEVQQSSHKLAMLCRLLAKQQVHLSDRRGMSLQARSCVSSSSPIILGFEILPMGIPLTHRRLLEHHRREALHNLR